MSVFFCFCFLCCFSFPCSPFCRRNAHSLLRPSQSVAQLKSTNCCDKSALATFNASPKISYSTSYGTYNDGAAPFACRGVHRHATLSHCSFFTTARSHSLCRRLPVVVVDATADCLIVTIAATTKRRRRQRRAVHRHRRCRRRGASDAPRDALPPPLPAPRNIALRRLCWAS
jgi:hypothetical protein